MSDFNYELAINEANKVSASTVADSSQIAAMLTLHYQKIKDLLEHYSGEAAPSGTQQVYATLSQMVKRYGMSRDKLERILIDPVQKGKIRVLRPVDYLGRQGTKSYHLQDFEKFFALVPA